MTTTFVYDTGDDFTSGVELGTLRDELEASSIEPALVVAPPTGIAGTTLTLVFDADLSSAEETTLHGDASPPAGGSVLGDHGGPPSPPSVTGSRGGNAALASLLTVLDTAGVITDDTSA